MQGDSIRDLFIPWLEVTNNHFKGSPFAHPKKVTIAELPGGLPFWEVILYGSKQIVVLLPDSEDELRVALIEKNTPEI